MGQNRPQTATEKRFARIRGDIPSTAPRKVFRPPPPPPTTSSNPQVHPAGARGSTAASKKRRRPSKKLVATLEELVDALPEVEELAPAPPARIVKGEMERFGESMARLVAGGGAKTGLGDGEDTARKTANPAGNRWAALRGYISATVEQNPAFSEKKEA
ncbi:unnamed protein product [Parascedosporium putredinis]|uniref:Ribosome biogenesis protein SLX9 n=1 Tax=Parascedosporium putredinis TaxID=1442378 RepID=A0A9P1MCU1_9PEZI|nr:unnamed protein product [Parascedosporium putredinis]CAI7997445.1 unnamed protein product [Parascedosporium putredinis]